MLLWLCAFPLLHLHLLSVSCACTRQVTPLPHIILSFPPLLLSLSLSFSLFLHLHPFHPVSGTQPFVSAVPAPLLSPSFSSSQPPGPGPPACATPSSAPPARRRLCRLISSEIGELQARAHMHRHFSCSKRHFRH